MRYQACAGWHWHQQVEVPIGAEFTTAFSRFRRLFRKKFRVEWEERLGERGEVAALVRGRTNVQEAEDGNRAWRYVPPKGGGSRRGWRREWRMGRGSEGRKGREATEEMDDGEMADGEMEEGPEEEEEQGNRVKNRGVTRRAQSRACRGCGVWRLEMVPRRSWIEWAGSSCVTASH